MKAHNVRVCRICFFAKLTFLQVCVHLKGTVSSNLQETTYPNGKYQGAIVCLLHFGDLGQVIFLEPTFLKYMYVCVYLLTRSSRLMKCNLCSHISAIHMSESEGKMSIIEAQSIDIFFH